ncbi:MAG: type II toxin-antitoxin system VapB family antitoxin [Methylococcaceae bacterium]
MVSTVYSGVKRLQQNYVKNGQNQAIRIPREFVFRGVNEVTLYKEGSCIIIEPVRKNWLSYTEVPKADAEFMTERPDLHNKEH